VFNGSEHAPGDDAHDDSRVRWHSAREIRICGAVISQSPPDLIRAGGAWALAGLRA
jgi:hypothetical protein